MMSVSLDRLQCPELNPGSIQGPKTKTGAVSAVLKGHQSVSGPRIQTFLKFSNNENPPHFPPHYHTHSSLKAISLFRDLVYRHQKVLFSLPENPSYSVPRNHTLSVLEGRKSVPGLRIQMLTSSILKTLQILSCKNDSSHHCHNDFFVLVANLSHMVFPCYSALLSHS